MSPLSANNILFPVLDRRRYLPLDIACSNSSFGASRQVKVHEKAVFFATANLGAEYSGTNQIDRALLDRFQPIEVTYPSQETETKVLTKRTGLEKKIAEKIVKIANSIRKEAANDELSTSISVRHTIEIAELICDGWNPKDAATQVILPLFSSEGSSSDTNERQKINSIVSAF